MNRVGSVSQLIHTTVEQCLDALKIRQHIAHKIGYGYALALGSAIAGTSLGLVLGNHYSQQAQVDVSHHTEKQQLLNELNSQILSIQMHPLRLLAITGNSIWQQYERNQFNTDFNHLMILLEKIERFDDHTQVHDPIPHQSLKTLARKYQTALSAHEEFIQTLWQQLDNAASKSDANSQLTTALGNPTASQVSLNFEMLSEELIRLRQQNHQKQKQSEMKLQQAELLRLTIILTSLMLSVGLAMTLTVITSRAIAQPIEQVTAIAQQVTASANFNIQVPITTQDEVALLAQALNQLTHWAGQYTQALQQTRNTLEQRVQDRTQSLQHSETQLRQQAETLKNTLLELQQAQSQLIQSEKMSSLGQMVAGIAHEINNPVNFIHGNLKHAKAFAEDLFYLLDLYQQYYPQSVEEIEDALDSIDLAFMRQDFPQLLASMSTGTQRIAEIVLSLRTFSRLDETGAKAIDIHESLDSALTFLGCRMVSTQKRDGINVIKNYGNLPLVECYGGLMNQVFMNILNNAIDALDEYYGYGAEGDPPTSAENNHSTGATTQLTPTKTTPTIEIVTQVIDAQLINIQITDNGPGISDVAQHRLFDPFFTTKAVGMGTGMGLSTSYQIVTQQHGGQLTFTTHPTQGSIFTIQIPLKLSVD